MGAKFDYAQAEEIRDAFARHGVRYLFIGKSGAILLGFPDTTQDADVFVEKTTVPFDLDLIFAPDESFAEAWQRHVDVEGFPVCHPDDIIASKVAANRVRDRESLPQLRAFEYWLRRRR